MIPPKFYLIAGDADALERLVPLGVGLVQLRAKGLSREDLRAQAVRAKACCVAHGAQLVLNDDWELALDLDIDFVHLGQEDLSGADLKALARAGVRIGISTHDRAELDRALGADPAYIALGPIYPTLLKQMPWAPQGLDRIGQWKAQIGAVPLVAIGGLTPERAEGVWRAGADSCAVVTDIAQAPDPQAQCARWIAAADRATNGAGRV